MENKTEDLGFARLDLDRAARTGIPETVFCPGKTKEQLLAIFEKFSSREISSIGTRCSREQYDFMKDRGLNLTYDSMSLVVRLRCRDNPRSLAGSVAICTGGTADMPVAEEAAQVAEFIGARVNRFYDIGVAGLHRVLSQIDSIRRNDVVICIAGMEGALVSVVAGLVKAPVIAVPVSAGYGASFSGLAPLLAMINSCAEGVSVVNIDNGFGAAVQACRILKIRDNQ
ncbi:MAG: nickel pincer cofactor biosynthesis protein LarB [Succinivibrionaceae bacterium]|nr:nickel pincer cofactor biosynthesis protein LarB [Succinivibrionaceae bacterium]